MEFRTSLVGLVFLIVFGVLAAPSHSKINPETVVGMWIFDEDEDDIARDLSANGNDGEIIGGKREDGKIGEDIRFDGGNSLVRVPHSDELSLRDFTVLSGIKPEVAGKWQYILCKTPPAPPPWKRNYSIQVWTGDTFLGGFDDGVKADAGQEPWTGVLGATRVTDDQWHHVAATYDGQVLKIYVDGVVDGQMNTDVEPVTNTEPIMIGTNVINQGVNGLVDEVAIFSVALAEEDIKDIVSDGLVEATGVMAVSATGKLTTTWASIKKGFRAPL